MMDEPPHGKPPAAGPESSGPASPDEREESDGAAETTPVEDPDPFDELWDPNMDTRPVRIRRTRGRTRPEPRMRGGGAPRGKRRDTA